MADPVSIPVDLQQVHQYLNDYELPGPVREFLDRSRSVELVVHPAESTWEFRFTLEELRPAPDSLQELLRNRFSEELSSLRQLHVVTFAPDREDPVEWLRVNWDPLVQSLRSLSAANTSLLKYARLKSDGSGMVVELADDQLVTLARDRDLETVLQDWIQERYGERPDLRFEVGDFQEAIEEDAAHFEEEHEEKLEQRRRRREVRSSKEEDTVLQGDRIKTEAVDIRELEGESRQSVTVQGEVIESEFIQTRSDKQNLVKGVITDRTDSIAFKSFTAEDESELASLEGEWVRLRGSLKRDRYGNGEWVIFPNDVNRMAPMIREDAASEKRVELHCHTSMSAMDALFDVEEIVERAAYWDHPAVAVTDHGIAHSFPEAAHAGEEYGVKVIYGVEGYLVQDRRPLVLNVSDLDADREITGDVVVLDCATTGINPQEDEVFHLSALHLAGGEIREEFTRTLNADVPESVFEHTRVTPADVESAADPRDVFAELEEFLGDRVVLTYEADATRHFLERYGVNLNQPVVHLRRLVEDVWDPANSDLERLVANRWGEDFDYHRDAEAAARHSREVFRKLQQDLPRPLTLRVLRERGEETDEQGPTNHIILLAVNQTGLRNLYRLISESHTEHFYKNPRMLRSKIDEHRVGVLVGSACEAGEIFQAVLHGESDEEIKERMKFYDLVEVQPVENNRFMLKEGGPFRDITSEEDIEEITRRIHQLGREMGKPVVGTGDVHFMDPEDEVYRRILQAGQDFDDADTQPPLYYRTTDEMIERFQFLGEDEALEVAVENPRRVAELCESIDPIPEGFYPPDLDRASERFLERTRERLEELYGADHPATVEERYEEEVESIIENEFANLYVMAAELVDKSHEDGYLVGSRGSVGSSFTAYLMDITEVNPLRPHYRCDQCQYSEFPEDPPADVGVDLPGKPCPHCGSEMERDGYNIPFEVFCGFEGEKIPDIDLNFSGEYQQEMFDYVETLFGEENVYRAGTIDTIAEKTAGAFVNSYLAERDLNKRRAEKVRLRKGLSGVKQNTSQHPGGMIIVPEDRSIYDFTPINYPANDREARFQTTHFDYHAMEDQLVKLDVLGHDDPTQLRHLQELTGVNPVTVPLDDEQTMRLFSDIGVLGLEPGDLDMETGVLAVPEFNTNFVRQMVEETRPESFADLIRISGLSHGEQVWQGNARDLIQEGKADLRGVISARDDIMNRLIDHGMPERMAFQIMEDVRKGRGLSEEQQRRMKAHGVPEWYVESSRRISYLFPKAHAAAYVIMAFRIAYYKVHYPTEFYASYFSLKTDATDARYIKSREQVEIRMEELEEKMNRREHTARDTQEYSVLEVMKEAYLRGISVRPPQLGPSRTRDYIIEEDGVLRAPYVTVSGLGGTVAESLESALQERPFSSIEDAVNRTGLNKAIVENARDYGFFEGIPEEEHYDLFG